MQEAYNNEFDEAHYCLLPNAIFIYEPAISEHRSSVDGVIGPRRDMVSIATTYDNIMLFGTSSAITLVF